MASTNDITGDRIVSKPNSGNYRNNFDKIKFDKPKKTTKPIKKTNR